MNLLMASDTGEFACFEKKLTFKLYIDTKDSLEGVEGLPYVLKHFNIHGCKEH